jgi:hypothetical protein
MTIEVSLHSPLAEAINAAIQPKLLEVGWGTGGQDDAALAEYIVLMLVNGKTQDEIASDISGEILGLPNDPVAKEFSAWLFGEIESLNSQINGARQPAPVSDAMQISGPDGDVSQASAGVISAYVIHPLSPWLSSHSLL